MVDELIDGFEFVVTWRSGDLSASEAEVNHNEPKRTGGER